MINGNHLIAGHWVRSDTTFRSSPYSGIGHEFAQGRTAEVEQAVTQASAAFETYSQCDIETRSNLLNLIAAELELQQTQIIKICCEETGLLENRIGGEFIRTVNQLRYFASVITNRQFLDLRHDPALPNRTPLPRPDMRLVQRPIGPVAVFGASNFPLAFSTAGGDTVAALAAGCPVVVKGHSAHPITADYVAQAMHAAISKSGVHPGVFSQIQSDNREAGQSLVQHRLIKAVGFTGSLAGGRALFNLCAARAEPIPFFGELGSINPVFILPQALGERKDDIASAWAASLTVGSGQLCTNPGLIIMQASNHAEEFVCRRRDVTPAVFKTTAKAWLNNPFMSEEIFGPLGTVVLVDSIDEMLTVARALDGQLTCTLQLESNDYQTGRQLLPILEQKAGRIIVNGFPTGVEVSDTMVHGGPYPASTNFGATSVGSLSIRRFLRPVCYQNVPNELLNRQIL